MVPTSSSCAAIYHKGYFRKDLNGFFSSLVAFFGTKPIFLKKSVRLPDAEFNAELIATNLKWQKAGTLFANCPFSL